MSINSVRVENLIMPKNVADAVLCYVSNDEAYFTTQPLAKQWGDDWNDAPYEHNAGYPYWYNEIDAEKGIEPWEVFVFKFESDLEEPRDWVTNSNYSVERINAGDTPWLKSSPHTTSKGVEIYAGTTFIEFTRMIRHAGGYVFIPCGRFSLEE